MDQESGTLLSWVVLAQGLLQVVSEILARTAITWRLNWGWESASKMAPSHSWQAETIGGKLLAPCGVFHWGCLQGLGRDSWLSPDWLIKEGARQNLLCPLWPCFGSHSDISAISYWLHRSGFCKVGGDPLGMIIRPESVGVIGAVFLIGSKSMYGIYVILLWYFLLFSQEL